MDLPFGIVKTPFRVLVKSAAISNHKNLLGERQQTASYLPPNCVDPTLI